MKLSKHTRRDLYYTKDHEWIDFQGSVAYIGICHFKLLGFKEIHEITFSDLGGFKRKGEIIARIKYKDYRIDAHMPVDGKIAELNDSLTSSNSTFLLQYAESNGWIALIIPSNPYERKDLLLPKEYQMAKKK